MGKFWLYVVSLVSTLCVVALLESRAFSADEILTAKIDKLVEELGVKSGSPGMAILIRQPGRVNFSKGYGLADLKDRTPITSATLFELASASKPMTATAVLALCEQGKLSLDDEVRKHLPELPDYQSQRKMTVRDLLHHTSGLPDYMGFQDVPARNTKYWINDDYVAQFALQKSTFPLRFQPGEKYEYSNTNYMLLATLVQRVSQRSFAEFMREEIFKPAGMTATFVCDSPQAKPRGDAVAAIGYVKEGGEWEAKWGAPPKRYEEMLTVGDGAIWSNVDDVARWDAAVRTGKFFKRPLARAALTPSRTSDGATNNYGLGWNLYYDGPKLIGMGHEGYWGGFSTTYYFNSTNSRTTVILSNCNSYGGDEFWYKVDAAVDQHLNQRRKRPAAR